ncbi:MAG: hypothetical protein ABSF23_07405 [Terracidiphilus sp.]|jgi:hypothetical protein
MDDLGELLNRPREYYNIDGVGELGLGLFAFSISLLFWMIMHTQETSAWHTMYTLFAVIGVTSVVIHYGSKAIKKHITYPRTGFVEYRAEYRTMRGLAGFAIAAATAALVSAGLVVGARHHFSLSTPFFLFGFVFAAGYIQFARKMPWKWIVFLAMIAGTLAIALLPAELLDRLAGHSHFGSALSSQALGAFWLTWVIFGALFLISGITTFWLYLRHTQAPLPEE